MDLDEELAVKSNDEIEQWMEPEKRKMEQMGKGDEMEVSVLRQQACDYFE